MIPVVHEEGKVGNIALINLDGVCHYCSGGYTRHYAQLGHVLDAACAMIADNLSVSLPVCLGMPKPLAENVPVAGWGNRATSHRSKIEDYQQLDIAQKVLVKVVMPLVSVAKILVMTSLRYHSVVMGPSLCYMTLDFPKSLRQLCYRTPNFFPD